jgi:class 3 adenylate cyclase
MEPSTVEPSTLADHLQDLSLTELIRLQNEISRLLSQRFERPMALAFSDIVGSTPYFARFGDEAGRKLQQRHIDLVGQIAPGQGGRIVDTAGDGAFTCFQAAEQAVSSFIELQTALARENIARTRDHQLTVRVGLHYGPTLTDGTMVTGDSVNLCSRVAGTASGSEIRLTRAAFQELSSARRRSCRALPAATVKGVSQPVEIFVLDWRDRSLFPTAMLVEESGELLKIPEQDTVACGRLAEFEGATANDIVLSSPDSQQLQRIGRWHFELRRRPEGLYLYQVSDGTTAIDGAAVSKGASVQIRAGARIEVGRVLTLKLLQVAKASSADDATILTDSPR